MQAPPLLDNGLGEGLRVGQNPAGALPLSHVVLPGGPVVLEELLRTSPMGLLVVNKLLLVHGLDNGHLGLTLGALVVVQLTHRTLQLPRSLLALLDLGGQGLLLKLGLVDLLPVLELGALPGSLHEGARLLPLPLLHVLPDAFLRAALGLGFDPLALFLLALTILLHAALVLLLLLLLLLVLLVLLPALDKHPPRQAAPVLLLQLRQVQAGGCGSLGVAGSGGGCAHGQHVEGGLKAAGNLTQRHHDGAIRGDGALTLKDDIAVAVVQADVGEAALDGFHHDLFDFLEGQTQEVPERLETHGGVNPP